LSTNVKIGCEWLVLAQVNKLTLMQYQLQINYSHKMLYSPGL